MDIVENKVDKIISLEELSKHNLQDDCWIAIDGIVYDITNYLDEHPGGFKLMLKYAGKDSTINFYQTHDHTDFAK